MVGLEQPTNAENSLCGAGDPYKKLQSPILVDLTLPHHISHLLPKPNVLPGPRLTKAMVPIVREGKARQAEALETSRAIGTGARKAEGRLLRALIDVWRSRDMSYVGYKQDF